MRVSVHIPPARVVVPLALVGLRMLGGRRSLRWAWRLPLVTLCVGLLVMGGSIAGPRAGGGSR